MATIVTDRLRLRPARLEDLNDLHAVLSDARAMAYWSTPPHVSLDESRAWLEAMMKIPVGEGEDFVVEHEGRVVGKAGLYRFPEIGYILHPDVWRRGFAREALGAVVHRAFDVHGLPAILADVDPDNAASLAVLGRLGFRETGRKERTLLIGGRWCDSVYLTLTPGDVASAR
jgi:[ribosomal protein S5]-alanine N-acetyltransferase